MFCITDATSYDVFIALQLIDWLLSYRLVLLIIWYCGWIVTKKERTSALK